MRLSPATPRQVRRRLPKRIYVPLPDAEGRRAIITHLLRGQAQALGGRDLDRIVASTGEGGLAGRQAWEEHACGGGRGEGGGRGRGQHGRGSAGRGREPVSWEAGGRAGAG